MPAHLRSAAVIPIRRATVSWNATTAVASSRWRRFESAALAFDFNSAIEYLLQLRYKRPCNHKGGEEGVQRTFGQRIAPAFTLMLLAPLMAELLPGATRFSSIFVFPIEMLVWGGGAVLIRALVRRRGVGWWGLAW